MATILETVDNPVDAVEPCRVCIKQLNSLSAVQNSFDVQLKKGIHAVMGLQFIGKDERRKIISSVCHVNRAIYDVTLTVGQSPYLWMLPTVDTGEGTVDPLRDERVTKVLRTQGDLEDGNVKVFDSTGTFMSLFSLPKDDVHTKLHVLDVATDMNDSIYVLVGLEKPGAERDEYVVYEFNNTADLHHKFPVRGERGNWGRLTVTDSGKVLVLWSDNVVDVHETAGQFVRSIGEGILEYACDITAANDGRVMVVDTNDSCVHIFSEHGDHLNKFKLQGSDLYLTIAFHRASEHVVLAGKRRGGKDLLLVEVYTKDGEFVRSTQIHDERIGDFIRGITVTTEGCIAVACQTKKVVVI
ncbi:hypothetical protein ACROYT_G025106 [Oculina patagonica]